MTHSVKQIGIMGGTFDPIHLGHLVAAEAAREAALLDEVWFMPANVPPHKPHQPIASPEQRLQMTQLAISDYEPFHLSAWEMERGGVSYTLDTVNALQAQYPHVEWYWIIGGDMVAYLPKWHGIDELMAKIKFVGLQRPGAEWDASILPVQWQTRVVEAHMPLMDISSTEIRRRVAQGRSIRYLVPEAVEQYAQRWGLYENES
ncbi:nicotinate-nucleotide adenylyltransferase [Paenibacillus sp. UMB4589-SE434]|uniref:nicotinate-nucleotide adenylyltransferase n=1 Tax=Paenibacillus sp. UMB4589-SE434 TaxID=3046314 RepID=UPI00254BC9DB|nr:nicotinate-nucleotide adenylyltransferase [Paenibacillus sp. UMB4589-SE434]MDK8181043.1 nicotinate-nucleotide adenylyltransferase [Paenibacillus sp. UMB4589-SE434]